MQDAKEEVRARLAIEDIIGEYVQLQRAGRNWRGLSPFNSEKTPSFYVSPEKNIWHDFSSNKGGDVFSFVMEVEGMDFRSALEYLARKAGIDLSLYDSGGNQELSKLKKRLLRAYELAVNYYQQTLLRNERAINYVFKDRGLSKEMVHDFFIGYAPTNGDALVKFLTKKGFSNKELSQAGLTNRFGGDIFRGRIVIALSDSMGRVVGFTGRTIVNDEKSPKYLNTPQTILYDKSRHVFGLAQAKEAIRKSDYAVIVEGNMDVISSHQAGVCNAVATAGTAMTEHHLRALSRLTGNIRLAFDSDKAGLDATERAISLAQNVGVDLTIISLAENAKDPDELIKKDAKLWQEAIDKAEPAVDWLLKHYSKREKLDTAVGKRKFTNLALKVVRKLKDPVEQEHYLQKVADYTQTSLEVIKSKLTDTTFDYSHPSLKKIVRSGGTIIDPQAYQDNLLAVALIDDAVQDLFRLTEVKMFEGEHRQAVAQYVASNIGKVIKNTPSELQKHDEYVKILLLKADARYADWNDHDRYFETARLLRQVTNENKQKEKDKLTEELRDAEGLGDETKARELRQRLATLIKEIQSGKR